MKATKSDKTVIRKHAPILRTLSRTSKKRRDNILKGSPQQLFSTIKKICKLLIRGGINLSSKDRKKFTPKMKNVARALHSSKNIKTAVLQHGEGFASILRVVLPLIGSVIGL